MREEARVVDVLVHPPAVPTVTVETNPRSTVVERNASSTLVTVTGGRSAVTTTVSTLSAPRVTATFDGGRFFPPQASTWEYYSAHVYRRPPAGKPPMDVTRRPLKLPGVGIAASHSATPTGRRPTGPPEGGIISSHSATPTGRSTRPEREWYTPAEYWDEVRPASTNEGALSGDGELSDEVTRIEDTTGRHSRTSRSQKEDSATTYREVEDSRREAAPVRSVRQKPNRLPPTVAPPPPPPREPPRNERVVERRPPVRERFRVEAEWLEPD